MKKIFIIFTLLLLPFQIRAAFIEGLEDVPVMEGLQQIQSDGIAFGNEDSRLVEAVLTSDNLAFSKVIEFYENTLPQMGWIYQGKRDKTLIFEREGETIEISEEQKKPLYVRITVKSKI
ncbi:MAG: hypothetical protein IJV97_04180 [Alphaproteobacteria bacterium]|nr:hypothetical protein [Alphaproteobacteria bacterium]